jgi:hypothetical protein
MGSKVNLCFYILSDQNRICVSTSGSELLKFCTRWLLVVTRVPGSLVEGSEREVLITHGGAVANRKNSSEKDMGSVVLLHPPAGNQLNCQ